MISEIITLPKVITSDELFRNLSLSPSDYKKVIIPNKNIKSLKDLVILPVKGGKEVGSKEYLQSSFNYFIRNRALTVTSYLLDYNSEGVTCIRPQGFIKQNLQKGDVLISKDSNIGEVVILDKDLPNYMIGAGIKILKIPKDKYYIFAFIKSSFFKEQLNALTSKGATIKHAKMKFLDCLIPIPNGKDSDEIIKFVSELVKSIIRKEHRIKEVYNLIHNTIEEELNNNQKLRNYQYQFPTSDEVINKGRLDTGMYSKNYKELLFKIENYTHGCDDMVKIGFHQSRGQNLQITSIGKSIYSEHQKDGFYKLLVSKNISEQMTIEKFEYLGNKTKLKTIKKGEIIFTCRGDMGRVIIFCSETKNTITNIDNLHIFNEYGELQDNIFVGIFLNFLKGKGFIDKIAISGSGADSFTKYHMKLIKIPKFPKPIKSLLASK